MKVTLKDEEQNLLTITDDLLDIPGWIRLRIERRGELEEIDIHIKELYPAVVAFLEKYHLNKEDKLR